MTDGPPQHVLPPASTTKVSLHEQAAGFFAQRRSGTAPVAPVQESCEEPDLGQLVGSVGGANKARREMAAREAEAPQPERYTLAQLVEQLQAVQARRRAVIACGDPDGPEDNTGWDPRDLNPRGAKLAAGIIAQQRRRR